MSKVLVLGTGSIGSRHIVVLRSIGADPIAVPIRTTRLGELEGSGVTVAHSVVAAREMGATAAVIATETSRHVSDIQDSLELGLHVLCEKPLAVNADDARDLPTFATVKNCRLFVAFCLRFDEGLLAFRAKLGEIGLVHSARIGCRSYLPDWRPSRDYRESYSARTVDGGVLRDMSHEIDYGLWLFGEAEAVWGNLENTGQLGIQSEELAEGSWRTHSGVRVSVGLDYISRVPVRCVRASGSKGELNYDFISGRLSLQKPGEPEVVECFERRRNAVYEAQAKAFINAIGGESTGVLATGAEAVRSLAVCDAWRRSALSGKIERVEV